MGDRGQSGVSANRISPREGVPAAPQGLCATSQFTIAHDETGAADRFLRLLQAEIIPRLMLAHCVSKLTCDDSSPSPSRKDVTELIQFLKADDTRQASDFVYGIIGRGVALEAIFLDLFAPAAKRIGELWEEDLCTFTDVTIMLSRLQCLVRELSVASAARSPQGSLGRLVVLCPAPGEQHIFGMALLEELLRREGWEVLCETPANVLECVRTRFVTMLGFTASDEERVSGLSAVIRAAREASENPDMLVMVGGRCFQNHPERISQVAADATAYDARAAIRVLHDYLRTKAAMAVGEEERVRRSDRGSTPSDSTAETGPFATSTRG